MVVITRTGTQITVDFATDVKYPYSGTYHDVLNEIFVYLDKEEAIKDLLKMYTKQITEQILEINRMEDY